MKKNFLIVVLLLSGCVQSVGLSQLKIGMSYEEFKKIAQPHYFVDKTSNTTTYMCYVTDTPNTTMDINAELYYATFDDTGLIRITRRGLDHSTQTQHHISF